MLSLRKKICDEIIVVLVLLSEKQAFNICLKVLYLLCNCDFQYTRLQEARLEVLKQLLKQREENHQELNIKRLDKLW